MSMHRVYNALQESDLRRLGFFPPVELFFGKLPGLTMALLRSWEDAGLVESHPVFAGLDSGDVTRIAAWWWRVPGLGTMPGEALIEELNAAAGTVRMLLPRDLTAGSRIR